MRENCCQVISGPLVKHRSDFWSAVTIYCYGVMQVNAQDAQGSTPLHLAAWSGYSGRIRLLVAHPEIKLDLMNAAGQTARFVASERYHQEAANIIARASAIQQKVGGS